MSTRVMLGLIGATSLVFISFFWVLDFCTSDVKKKEKKKPPSLPSNQVKMYDDK